MQVGRVTIKNRFCKKEVISIRLFEKKTPGIGSARRKTTTDWNISRKPSNNRLIQVLLEEN
jgi:hypothetical protein